MPLIAEAYAGRVEMLNAIFGGGGKGAPSRPGEGQGGKHRIEASGADIGTGLRALAALQRKT